MPTNHNTIIVGAGQAGLAASYHLKQRGIDHIVLNKGRIGESWITQRWDSFVLNTPNVINSLPGKPFYPANPRNFEPTNALVKYLDDYATEMELPIKNGVTVTSATRNADGITIDVSTDQGDYQATNLIVASGNQNIPVRPAAADQVPANVTNLDTTEYKNADQLPAGSVLVVGSAQSGAQIAEDLLKQGRTVYLSTSKVGRFRRHIRGKDVMEWVIAAGMMNHTPDSLENPADQHATQPLASGLDGGQTLSLQSIAAKGVNLLGRIIKFEGTAAVLKGDLRNNIEFADAFSARIIGMINPAIDKMAPGTPPLDDEPADNPAPTTLGVDAPTRLDLNEAGITSIIWTTGFEGDYSWIDIDGHGVEHRRPVQKNGASPAQGLYFIGTPWLRTRGSGIIYGVDKDAEAIAQAIAAN